MVPLGEQLYTPLGMACGALYLALFLAPFIALRYASREQRALALFFAAAAVLVRLYNLQRTPAGINPDDLGTLIELGYDHAWTWQRMFGQGTVNGGTGWCDLPWYVGYRLTDNLLAIRVVGLAWNGVLCLYAVVFASRFVGTAGAAVAAAVLAFTPWSLWLSRNVWGAEIMLQQLFLLWAIERLREKAGWWSALVCGLMVSLLQYTYLAARISLVLPLALLVVGPWKRRLRTAVFLLLAHVVIALGIWLHVATHPPDFWVSGTMAAYDPHAGDWSYMIEKFRHVLWSLYNPAYSVTGTLSLVGAQTLSPVVLVLIALGALVMLRDVGRAWVVGALLGAVPSWMSLSPGGNSHRMMMMLVPLALLAGGALRLVPERARAFTSAALVALIAFTGLSVWVSPDFWAEISTLGSMQWALPLRAAVSAELAAGRPGDIRVHPSDGSVRLLSRERGEVAETLDLRTEDLASNRPLTLVWRGPESTWTDLFEQLVRRGLGTVERPDPFVTIVRLPHGWQGLSGNPPRHGWQFSVHCKGPEDRLDQRFVNPLLFESNLFPQRRADGPCVFRWTARAARPIHHPFLELESATSGTVRIDDVSIPAQMPVTALPEIGAGQRITVEVQARDRLLTALFNEGIRGGASSRPLDWEAVTPEE